MEKSNKLEQKPNIVREPKVVLQTQKQDKEIKTDETVTPVHDVGNGYVEFNKGLYSMDALKQLKPDLFALKTDNPNHIETNFGTTFPRIAKKGNIFVRVDVLPNRVFKFDGKKWLEQNKNISQSYLGNKDYIEFLINKLNNGEYDLDTLNEIERQEIEAHLKGNQNT